MKNLADYEWCLMCMQIKCNSKNAFVKKRATKKRVLQICQVTVLLTAQLFLFLWQEFDFNVGNTGPVFVTASRGLYDFSDNRFFLPEKLKIHLKNIIDEKGKKHYLLKDEVKRIMV